MLRSQIQKSQSCNTAMFSSVRNLLFHIMYVNMIHHVGISHLLLYLVLLPDMKLKEINRFFVVQYSIDFYQLSFTMQSQTIKHPPPNVAILYKFVFRYTPMHLNSVLLFIFHHYWSFFPCFLRLIRLFVVNVNIFVAMHPFRLFLCNIFLTILTDISAKF